MTPLAVIGLDGRFPGADSVEALWALFREGRDAIRPQSRWPGLRVDPDLFEPDAVVTDRMAALDDVEGFDAAFFGLPPAEAAALDPQQRLLLGAAWGALEAAGQLGRRDRPIGVWVAAGGSDHARAAWREGRFSAWSAIGGETSLLANRVSAVLGLRGPSVVVNAGCSSVPAAIEAAGRALDAGEVDVALVGAVSLVLDPAGTVALSQGWMLSPEGRSRPFDGAADGYVRGEAVGALVLRRLADACRDGDPIALVVRGVAVHHAGDGVVVGSEAWATAQRTALARAGVAPAEVGYVEAHAIGAPSGDRAELEAIGAAMPGVAVGSAKAAVGHAEWAAGLVGMARLAGVFRHRELPPQRHLSDPIPAAAAVRIPRAPTPFDGRIALLDTSSIGGVCAAVVLEAPPEPAPPAPRAWRLLTPSAPDEARRRELTAAWAASGADVADVARTLAVARPALASRGYAVVTDLAKLTASAPVRPASELVFAFTGQGSQRRGMGLALARARGDFAEALDRVDALLRPHLGRPVRDLLDDEGLDDTGLAQPALFALQLALAWTWEAAGVRPDRVLGHSVGELAACVVAGLLDPADGAAFAVLRGRLVSALPAGGGMTAFFAPEDVVAGRLPPALAVAGVNGPALTVVAGELGALAAFGEALADDGIDGAELVVSHAFHSPRMDPVVAPIDAATAGFARPTGRVPLASTLLAREVRALPEGYWGRHAREAVRFLPIVAGLPDGARVLEIGPGATLCKMGGRIRPALDWVPSLAPDDEPRALLEAAGRLWAGGHPLDRARFGGEAGRVVAGPTTPLLRVRPGGEPRAADVVAAVSELLGRPADRGRGLMEQGLDSVRLVALAGRLGVPVALLFEVGTVAALEDAVRTGATAGRARAAPRAAEAAGDDPVVVVGMACRYPRGIDDPRRLWELREVAGEVVGPVPERRQADLPAGATGAFFEDVTGFDAGFWGMSGREAALLDPQHRLALELAWEAVEDAGWTRADLAGSATGLYLGLIGHDFARRSLRDDPDMHGLLGGLPSAAPGRLAHALDLHGPALVVDTACSSSLVAVDLARRALASGECDRALVGGVNLVLDPAPSVALARGGALSPDGRCRAFDAAGDGYGRAEGGAFVALRRLSDARRAGDRVLAVLAGSAVNQDGFDAAFVAPNGSAQRELLERLLAGVDPDEVGYAEAHGTGTPLGDPIEVAALRAALGVDRRARPLPIGSVKANLGHTEGAAGVTGLVAAVQVVASGLVPPHRLRGRPNPRLDLRGLELPGETRRFEGRYATVSSFGMTGTNAAVLVAPPPPAEAGAAPGGPPVLVLSARTAPGVRALARRWLAELPDEDALPAARAAAGRRTRHAVTAAVAAGSVGELERALRALLERGDHAPEVPPAAAFHGPPAPLPPYPWQRERHWPDPPDDDVPAGRADPSGWRYTVAFEPVPDDVPRLRLGPVVDARDGLDALLRAGPEGLRGRWVRAEGAAPAGVAAPKGAAAWGAVRSLANERPDLGVRLLDASDPLPDEVPDLPELAWREGRWLRPILGRAPEARRDEVGDRWVVEGPTPGFLGELAFRRSPGPRAPLGPREVEVEVRAFGVSFADALDVLALTDGLPGGPYRVGREWAGTVRAVGTAVTRLRPGDAALGLAPHGVASRLRVDERLAARAPASVPGDATAGLPLAAVLAWRGLAVEGRVAPGERVLVHSATGGVGQLALAVVRHLGAEPVATAGNAARRRWLEARGVRALPSRSLAFAEALADEGVDVVLDSLAGDGPAASAGLLRPGGRLVEIGRRGRRPLALPPGRAHVRLDAAALAVRDPGAVAEALDAVVARLDGGALEPPITTVFGPEDLHSALRGPIRAWHLGRHVVRMPAEGPGPAALALLPADGPVLVTGGFGALGLAVAERLARRGFRRLVLVGRRVPAPASWRAVRDAGAAVEPRAVDVSREEEVAALVASLPGLRGVVHCAGVLDDAPFEGTTPERAAAVAAPKSVAARHLDAHCPPDVDFFVLFSSAASWLGTPGQAAYAAANAELDALAAHRRARGLPGVSLGWGPWAGGGMARGQERALAADGTRMLDPEPALDAFEAAVLDARDTLVVDVDWPRLGAALASLPARAPALASRTASRPSLADLRRTLADVLRIPEERVAGPLRDLGLDSISGAELRARVAGLPAVQALLAGATVEELAGEAPAAAASGEVARVALGPDRAFEVFRRAGAPARLVCFPFAGVGAGFYRDWDLGDGVEVRGVQYPGRAGRAAERAHDRLAPLVAELAEAVAPLLDRPTVFFGHCMGGLVAWAVCRALRAEGLSPAHLVVSACPPPDAYLVGARDPATLRFDTVPDAGVPVHHLPTRGFVDALRMLDFAPARPLLRDPDLLRAALPTVRADFEACATFRYRAEPPLALPITSLGGAEDPFFDRELDDAGEVVTHPADWRRATTGPFRVVMLPGDHYFLLPRRDDVLAVVREALAAASGASAKERP